MASALYNRDILRLASSLGQPNAVQNPDGVAECRSTTCGSKVGCALTLDAAGRIGEIALDVHACALGQASAAIVLAYAKGEDKASLAARRTQLAAYLDGSADAPGEWPGMELLVPAREYPARHPALLLPYDAVLLALAAALVDDEGEAA